LITDFSDDELEDKETEQLLDQRLPTKHRKFYNMFSKVQSDKLPLHRSYNYKIHLEVPLQHLFSPLYRQSEAEL